MNRGHYMLRADKKSEWCYSNDLKYKLLRRNGPKKQEAYMLFFEQIK